MIEGLIGVLILIAILCVVIYVIKALLATAGIAIPPVVSIIVGAVILIVCLLLLARVLGVAIPGI